METQTTNLGRDTVSSLLFKLALPAIVAQLVNVLYNIVDRIFIGRMANGEIAMAGVGVAFPIIMIVSAFSSLIGMGGAPLASIKMGEGDEEGAEEILNNSFSMLVVVGAILTALVLIIQEPILWAFGASETTIGYAKEYLSIYAMGTIGVQIALGMNPFINAQGFAKVGMMTVVIGAIINIVLDPIFIFGLDLGVTGAALATILSQIVSAIYVVVFLTGKKSILKIRKKHLIPKFATVKLVLSLGISTFIMQSTESLVLISLNNMLMIHGGDLAVSSMTIMSSVMQIITLPVIGLSQGAQPIISYNYGAQQMDRVRDTFKLHFKLSIAFTTIFWLALMLLPGVFVSIFNSDPHLMEIATWSIRIYFAGIFAIGAQFACQQTFLALGKARISLVLALLRKIVLLIPLIFILPNFTSNKLFGILLAEPVADIVASITTVVVFSIFYKNALADTGSGANKDADAYIGRDILEH